MPLVNWIESQLSDWNLPENWANGLATLIGALALIVVWVIAYLIAKRLILAAIRKLVTRSRTQWDDILLEKKFFDRLAHIFPALVLQAVSSYLFPVQDHLVELVTKGVNIYLVVMLVMALFALLQTLEYFFSQSEGLKDQPIGSYFQLVRIILSLMGGILVLSFALDKSPLFFLSTFGAMTAIILLIFRDTILGFVASIQIAANDMVHIGDWIEMPKYGTDGDVIQITLATIKVRNFDKTISHIPTYAFISESFRNWQGMRQSGGRRIKRSIYIKQSSIRFCREEDLKKLAQVELLKDRLQLVVQEINQHNQEKKIDKSILMNGRQLTNLGLFREYTEAYLRQLPFVNLAPGMTLMVRQLDPTPHGIPLQVYCFTNDTRWVPYEKMQADIFDHLLASISYFDLKVFEYPGDIQFISPMPDNTPQDN